MPERPFGVEGETQLAKFTVLSLPAGLMVSMASGPAIAVVARDDPRLERLLLLPVPGSRQYNNILGFFG